FEKTVKPGGTLIYDPYGIHHSPTRKDINVISVNAMEATFELGNPRTYNMLLLGALIKVRGCVSVDDVMKGLKKTLPERHHHLLPANEAAIRRGMELAE
ncbi:MAG: 2-oxoacid:acceptor oxidoreductase family protein, partial [Muribaculaceae bacterium]|nr:2-oxoacid:acceptor oxidoreductase family protein [Muribaculaceae bacterium]